MNNLSKKQWIDLVFEGRNKSYGAYELRAKSGTIMIKALFIGIMLALSLISIPVIANYNTTAPIAESPEIHKPIEIDFIVSVDTEVFRKDKEEIKNNEEPVKRIREKSAEDIIQHTTPIITDALVVAEEIKDVDELRGQKTGAENVEGDPEGKILAINPGNVDISGNVDGTESGTVDEGMVYPNYTVDKKAEFPGGIQNFMRIIQRTYRIPDIQTAKQYTVFVSFVVETDGSISDIKVLKDPGNGLGDEAIRTLKSIKTKWEPGIYKGKPVRMLHHLPISVVIK